MYFYYSHQIPSKGDKKYKIITAKGDGPTAVAFCCVRYALHSTPGTGPRFFMKK
jgi:hypothetical protein